MEAESETHDNFLGKNPQPLEAMTAPQSLDPATTDTTDQEASVSGDAANNPHVPVVEESDDSRPLPEFKIGQVVYASDQDGVIYEATIRRRLYGTNHQRQVLACMVSSVNEANEILAQEDEPMWHYFVHYHGWNVKWDRWSPATKIFAKSDDSKWLAQRLQEEHRKVKDELLMKGKSKRKTKKSLNAEEFLMAWKGRMLNIYSEYELRCRQPTQPMADAPSEEPVVFPKAQETSAAISSKSSKPPKGSSAELQAEIDLQKKCLTRLLKHGDLVPLPSTLKRILVEAWENISQCNSVQDLPARVTVRNALDKYLESKGIVGSDAMVKVSVEGGEPLDDGANANKQQWMDMRDGICQFFDEALPHQLLYAGETAQLYALTASSAEAGSPIKSYSEVYGCEHLLRLLTRLPALLLDHASETDVRPILAKVNDFVRFLHKDSSLFTLHYRPYNDAELREKKRLVKVEDRKRKRFVETVSTPGPPTKAE